jgi:hypothetical protein
VSFSPGEYLTPRDITSALLGGTSSTATSIIAKVITAAIVTYDFLPNRFLDGACPLGCSIGEGVGGAAEAGLKNLFFI